MSDEREFRLAMLLDRFRGLRAGQYVTVPEDLAEDFRAAVKALPPTPRAIRAKFTAPKERRLHDAR